MTNRPWTDRRRRARRALVLVHSYYLRDTRPRRHADALVAAGWEVDVICARDAGEPARERVGSISVHRLPARRRRGSKTRYVFEYVSFALMALAAVTRAHLRRRYRVVYVIGIPNFIVFAALVPRMTGARVLLDMRDPIPEFYQAKFQLPADHPLIRLLRIEERLSARFASHVLTVVPSMAALYRRTGARRISVVMNAPDPRLFSPSNAARDPSDRTLLYAGTVAPRYGVDLAVLAVARLREAIPGIRLRIVGDGDLLASLRRLALTEGIADRVSFEDPVPLDRIPAVVGECWIGVQPNRDDPLMRHSLSTKILEWCRLGLPVVCGTTPPLRDLFGNEEIALHPPGDLEAMCDLLLAANRDPAALARRAERARAAAERIRYEDQAAAFLAVVEGAAAAAARGAAGPPV